MSWLGSIASDLADKLDDVIPDGFDLSCITKTKEKVCDVNQLAQETTSFCMDTVGKAADMVSFAAEIKSTLDGFRDGMTAEDLKAVRELVSGEKVRSAMALAGEIHEVSLTCVDKSIEMTGKMQEGYDVLPEPIKIGIDQVAGEDEDRDLTVDVEPDIEELTGCLDAVRELNLFTAMEAGTRAFNGLSAKADVCTTLFDRIKGFAEAVVSITGSIMDLDVHAVISKVKDMCRCIRLTEVMRLFAEQVKRLVSFIIDLFKECSEKLSCLWAALDYAKDCLAECAAAAVQAKDHCVAAFEHGCELITTCGSIKDQVGSLKSLDMGAVETLQSLAGGEEINRSISLAQSMDDVMLECITKVVGMVDKVKEGWDGLPSIVTDGIDDLMEGGKADDDPEPPDTSRDISELDERRDTVERATLFDGVTACQEGCGGAMDKVEVCKSMLTNSQSFADSLQDTVSAFMGTWNLETMGDKIKDICRCARLGEDMRLFAEQIKNLVLSILALLKSIMDKLTNIKMPGVSDAMDAVSDAMGAFKKFW